MDRTLSSTASSKMVATSPLSALHAMLRNLERQTDAKRLNSIVNHPDIYRWVRGPAKGALDLSEAIANPNLVCLLGTHGGILFSQIQTGLWEAHTQILPAGRGSWGRLCVQACLHWLFTRADAMEVMTRCPKGNLAATAMARAIHGTYEFTSPHGWIDGDKPLAADIYSLNVQTWMRTAPGLAERGQWFHKRLEAEMARHNVQELSHPDDPVHDRYVGAATEMFLGGQPDKAVILYNRWAAMAGYLPVTVTSRKPLEVDIGTATIAVRGEDDFWVPDVRPLH